jgi:DNA mismatch repair protein MutS2
MSLKDQSLEMLEFNKVRDILAGFTAFAVSREMALTVIPSASADEVRRRLKLSAEARHLLSVDRDFSMIGIYDIREAVVLASRGKVLELQTLLDVGRTLAAIRLLHTRLNGLSSEIPLLGLLNASVTPLPGLEKEISRCISPGAELLDTASEKLSELRRLLRDKRHLILERLDSIIKDENNQRYIQEELVTERDGRYVIPLKVELRKEIKGIVHDISNTGATAFVEPMSTVDLGNELREMVIEEAHEVERILSALSQGVAEEEVTISLNLKLIAEIDFELAKARFAERWHAVEPMISGENGSDRLIKLIDARHPLLRGKPVPLSIEIGPDYSGLVITGPNTGGKTVALKTIGLFALMAQAGLPVPAAEESSLPVFDNIFADIGDEQSIEQTLSTFSWHMGNIARIVKESSRNSLVLLDELGTATDPGEGAALAQSILRRFLDCGTMVVATTHFGELKAFAHATPGLKNASLDFDPVTLAPTYHLTLGIPGGSNALAIASQLGLPREIIDDARARLGRGSQEVEDLLADLMVQKQQMDSWREDIAKEKEEAKTIRRQLEEEKRQCKEEEQKLLREVRFRLVREGDELQKYVRQAMDGLKKEQSKEKLEKAQRALADMREQLKGPNWQPASSSSEDKIEATLAVNDRVTLTGMNLQGTVVSAPDSNGQIEVQVGSTKVKLAPENLEKLESAKTNQFNQSKAPLLVPRRTASFELDLRGKRADEVEIQLDAFLNDAGLTNLPQVRIIHGIGTGVVRQIVRQYLASHPLVNSFRSGKREEGGDGATVVQL